MKKLFLFLSFSFTYLLPQAQTAQHDSWTIKLNKKIILEAFKNNEAGNTRTISFADLRKKGSLEIIYQQADTQQEKTWKRSFMLLDENNQELLRKDSTLHAIIPCADLEKLFSGKKKIMIYTTAIPLTMALAARVRIRRIHLCTLELQ